MNAKTPVDVKKVTKAYSGKHGVCMCGCSGKYWYSSQHELPNYITSEDVNDKQVKRVVNLINANLAETDSDTNYVYLQVGNRGYCVYFD